MGVVKKKKKANWRIVIVKPSVGSPRGEADIVSPVQEGKDGRTE